MPIRISCKLIISNRRTRASPDHVWVFRDGAATGAAHRFGMTPESLKTLLATSDEVQLDPSGGLHFGCALGLGADSGSDSNVHFEATLASLASTRPFSWRPDQCGHCGAGRPQSGDRDCVQAPQARPLTGPCALLSCAIVALPLSSFYNVTAPGDIPAVVTVNPPLPSDLTFGAGKPGSGVCLVLRSWWCRLPARLWPAQVPHRGRMPASCVSLVQ